MKLSCKKTIKTLKPFDIVEIEWIDTIGDDTGWRYISSVQNDWGDPEKLFHKTVGYFLAKTKLSLVVCQSIQKKIWYDNDRSTDGRMEIPLTAIKKIRKLK